MNKHLPAALSTARRYAKKYQEGGTVDLPEIKVTPEPPPQMVSDEDLSMAQLPQQPASREGGLWQTVPKFVELMGSPEGRSKLDTTAGDYLLGRHVDESGNWVKADKPDAPSFVGSQVEGIKGMVTGPGEAMAGRMSPEQQADWGAGTALGLVGAGTFGAYTGPKGDIGVFGGRGSALADHAALAEAEKLEQQGLNQNQVHFRTGWFRDQGTGEWMYHHNMKDATLAPWLPTGAKGTDAEGEFYIPSSASPKLPTVFKHPNLYEAYPILKDWDVVPTYNPNEAGSVDFETKTMRVAPQTEQDMLGTLTHEANHIIQRFEGFSGGSNVARWLPAEYPKKHAELQDAAKTFNEWVASQGVPVNNFWKAIQKAQEDPGMLNPWEQSIVGNVSKAGKYDEALSLIKKRELLNKAMYEAFDKYSRVYGEAMSRQSELRRTMTPEESRRVTIPNAMRMLKRSPVDPKELLFHDSPLTPASFPTAKQLADIEESYRISPEGFYARADRVVDEKGPKQATADEWMSFLKNQQISPKEDQYIGISNWLKQEGEQRQRPGSNRPLKISKEELQEHIQASSPKLGTYEATGIPMTPRRLPEEWGGNPPNMWEEAPPVEDWPFDQPHELEGHPHEPGEEPGWWRHPEPEAYGEDTKYSGMVIPGGKNYREVKLRYFPKEVGRSFYSEHYPLDENQMGAVRADERKINGKNTFHVHEMQSDWHQMGAKAGYGTRGNKELMKAAEDRLDAVNQRILELEENNGTKAEFSAAYAEQDAADADYHKMYDAYHHGIPDAPFKQTWDDLLFKQTLRHAVEKGYDQVSWPGSPEAIKKTEQWPSLEKKYDPEKKVDKWFTGKGADVTSVVRRYMSTLPELGNKLAKQHGIHVGMGRSSGYVVHTLPLTPAFKKAIMDEGFPFKFQKGGKVEQTRKYTMPLAPGSDRKTISKNIKEFHTGPTYAHTAAKFGKERARKQAIAVAMSSARKYAGKGKALGGPNISMENMVMRSASAGLRREGMINSSVPGRTDKIPLSVKAGSYVVPADTLSAIGQGNSLAGSKIFNLMFNRGPYGLPTMKGSGRSGAAVRPMRIQQQKMPSKLPGTFAEGGAAEDEHIPIIAAGGEAIIPPDVVRDIGHGSLKAGHRVLDKWVIMTREAYAKTLKSLPGPKK